MSVENIQNGLTKIYIYVIIKYEIGSSTLLMNMSAERGKRDVGLGISVSMSEKYYYQCQNCGSISETRFKYKAKDAFVNLWCDECEKETSQLYIGVDLLEKYLYMNPNFDERFFIYD